MHPVVFTIPFIEKDIPGYGLMLMLAFLITIWWATRRAERSGANPDVVLNCGFVCLVAGVVGCRLMYVWHYWEQFAVHKTWPALIWAIVDVTRGGLEFYGGFILSILSVIVWLALVERVSLRWYFDIFAPSAALGLAIGRIGCFLNGCCFGGVCDLPWAVQFPYASPAMHQQWLEKLPGSELPQELLYNHSNGVVLPLSRESLALTEEKLAAIEAAQVKAAEELAQLKLRQAEAAAGSAEAARLTKEVEAQERRLEGARQHARDVRGNLERYHMKLAELQSLSARFPSLPVHPAQLYSTLTAGLIAFFLNALYYRRSRDGQVICTLLLIEPVTRWLLEVIRADNPTDTLGAFTISQGLAMGMTALGAIGLLILRGMPPRSPRARIWTPEPIENAKPAAAR